LRPKHPPRAETAIPTQAAQEQPEEVKEDTPSAITTTAENPETTVAAQEVPPADEVKASSRSRLKPYRQRLTSKPLQRASPAALATILSAYYSDMSRALDATRQNPQYGTLASPSFAFPSNRPDASYRARSKRAPAPRCSTIAALASVEPGFATASSSIRDRVVTPLTFSVPFNFIVADRHGTRAGRSEPHFDATIDRQGCAGVTDAGRSNRHPRLEERAESAYLLSKTLLMMRRSAHSL